MVQIPTDRPVYEGEIATYWIDDGILVSLSKSVKRTVENLSANAALVKSISGGKRMPLLIYLAKSPVPDREAQRFSRQQLPLSYTAMAMISEPGLSQFIMNLLFKFQSPGIPMKNFGDVGEAREWLKLFR